MKNLFACSLVFVALFTVFLNDVFLPVSKVIHQVGGCALARSLPFEWKHAFAASSVDTLDEERRRLRYQWAASCLQKEELEARIKSLNHSLRASQNQLDVLLSQPAPNHNRINKEVQRHDQLLEQRQASQNQLATLNETLKHLNTGEQIISDQIQALDHRLHMVRLKHVNHDAQQMLMEIDNPSKKPSSIRMLDDLEKQERIESFYLDRFAAPETTPNDASDVSVLERARAIVQSHRRDS